MLKQKWQLRRMLRKTDYMSAAIFWAECATSVISYLCATIMMTLILCVTLQVDTPELTRIVEITALAMIPLWCIPIAFNTRRRLRDAGYGPKAYLWLLLPVIGWAVFIVLLCAKSIPKKPDGTPFI